MAPAPTLQPAPRDTEPVAPTPQVGAVRTREYALGLHELKGLPSTVTRGTVFELWAAIEPPYADTHFTGRVVPKAVVTDVIAPITPDGPISVIIAVPVKHMSKLVYAHRWGTFSVALL